MNAEKLNHTDAVAKLAFAYREARDDMIGSMLNAQMIIKKNKVDIQIVEENPVYHGLEPFQVAELVAHDALTRWNTGHHFNAVKEKIENLEAVEDQVRKEHAWIFEQPIQEILSQLEAYAEQAKQLHGSTSTHLKIYSKEQSKALIGELQNKINEFDSIEYNSAVSFEDKHNVAKEMKLLADQLLEMLAQRMESTHHRRDISSLIHNVKKTIENYVEDYKDTNRAEMQLIADLFEDLFIDKWGDKEPLL